MMTMLTEACQVYFQAIEKNILKNLWQMQKLESKSEDLQRCFEEMLKSHCNFMLEAFIVYTECRRQLQTG